MRIKEIVGAGLRHLKFELVALVTEVFTRFVAVVAVRAVEFILVVRRRMRILRLHFARFFHQRLRVVALRAGFRRRFLRIFRIRPVADGALNADGGVTVRNPIGGGSRKSDGRKRQHNKQSLFHGKNSGV